jgi:hypothetical protein
VHHAPAARDVALLSEAIRAESVSISGHAADTPAILLPFNPSEKRSHAGETVKAPTGIEPV